MMVNETPNTGGSLGLGLDGPQEALLIETIGTMFGFEMLIKQREEDAEMFPQEGTQ